jgi:cytidylate kinase
MSIAEEHIRWDSLVDSQMQQWQERDKEKKRQLQKPTIWDQAHITISRQYGARGYSIGQVISRKLDWQIYSKNLVDHISETAKLRDKVIGDFDEKKHLATIPQILFDPGAYSSDKYYRHLLQVVLAIAHKGRAVIVGRGANFITDHDLGLHIRVTASLESRIKRYAEKERVTQREARKKVMGVDQERAEFVKHYFHCNIDDSHHYDLIVNVEKFSNEQVADMVIAALEIKLSTTRPELLADE